MKDYIGTSEFMVVFLAHIHTNNNNDNNMYLENIFTYTIHVTHYHMLQNIEITASNLNYGITCYRMDIIYIF